MKNKISICIPTYEQHGKGYIFLKKLLETVKTQTYTNYEVVISDHSTNNELKNLCDLFSNNMDIIYVKNTINRGNSPFNTNNAIKFNTGDIIKIMFQDDFFITDDALEKINNAFNEQKCMWLVSGCNQVDETGTNFFQEMVPYWNDNIILGLNTISSPSVLSFIKDDELEFDEKLVMLMDCDFYFQLYKKYGLPYIINDYLITNRYHETQVSRLYNWDNFSGEINYVKNKYKIV
jgi:glycosyltransferase involved in cell wall biosynthesis